MTRGFPFAFSPDNSRIAFANTMQGTLRIHDIQTGREIRRIQAHTPGTVTITLDYSPNGRFVASSASDNSLRVFDAETGTLLRKFYGDKRSMGAISFGPESMRIASLSLYHSVQVWDLAAAMGTFRARMNGLKCIKSHPPKPLVALAGARGETRIYDLNSRLLLRKLIGGNALIQDVAFNADGSRHVTGGDDRKLRVWDTQTGTLIKSHPSDDTIMKISHHPTKSLVAICSRNNILHTWDPQSSAKPKRLTGDGFKANDAAFSPDGARLVGSHPDGTILVWDANFHRRSSFATEWIRTSAIHRHATSRP